MKDFEQRYNEIRKKMADIDTLVAVKTENVITAFFDPVSVEVFFNSFEAAFLRLIPFFYIITHEGKSRLNFDFLTDKFKTKGLDSRTPEEFRKICHHLRTKFQHNMDLSKVRDKQMNYTCEDWFEKECGTKRPSSEEDWKKSATALINECLVLLVKFEEILNTILDPRDEFAAVVIADWETRLSNHHPPHKYIEIAHKVAFNIGYSWLDLSKFCLKYHQAWLAELGDFKDYQFEQIAQKQIERDLAAAIKEKNVPLPFTTDVLISRLGINPGPDVKAVLRKAQEMYLERIYTIDEMIEVLKKHISTK